MRGLIGRALLAEDEALLLERDEIDPHVRDARPDLRGACSTASSSSGRSEPFAPAGSSSRGSASATSSSAPWEPTCAPATGSGSSGRTEGPGGRPLYFPALPPGRGRGAA